MKKTILASACLTLFAASAARSATVEQIFRPERLTRGNTNVRPLQPIDEAAWIWAADEPDWTRDAADTWNVVLDEVPSVFRRFRCDFTSDGTPFEIDVSADEHFALLLDGAVIARGPQFGSVTRWHYGTYAVRDPAPGAHRLEAVVWRLGDHAPIAQIGWRGGFILKASGPLDAALTTGKGPWRTVRLSGTKPTDRGTSNTYGAGSQFDVTGESFLTEAPTDGWTAPVVVRSPIVANPFGGRLKGWMLFPTAFPDPIAVRRTPGRVVNAARDLTKPFRVPAHAERELWWDLGDYYCAYPELVTSGGRGASVTWGWAESLYDENGRKQNRDEWKGMSFVHTLTDTFRADGRKEALFTTPWWRCGRWCRLVIRTAGEPLEVRRVALVESHDPLAMDAAFACDDPDFARIDAICRRALEMCAHGGMTVDCPYYEQQMYPGDSRIQLEILNALTRDARLARHVMTTFDADRRSDGFVAMNFPTRGTQESATYTFCWILMFRDFLRWHDDAAFLRARMPGVRNALMNVALYEGADGLVRGLPGWCFSDWVPKWVKPDESGVAPGGGRASSGSSVENLFYLLSLQAAAEIDAALGETALAAHWKAKSARLAHAIVAQFWDARSNRLADTKEKNSFCEHAQALAILADALDRPQRESALAALADGKDLAPASSYFAHYLFDAYVRCGRADLVRRHLSTWKNYLALGAKTTFEVDRKWTRSDCHAWSACPAYFFQTAFAGVTPAAPFFKRVRVAPQPAGLRTVHARTPSPHGFIETDFTFDNGRVTGTVTLPKGLVGDFVWGGQTSPLAPGSNRISLP